MYSTSPYPPQPRAAPRPPGPPQQGYPSAQGYPPQQGYPSAQGYPPQQGYPSQGYAPPPRGPNQSFGQQPPPRGPNQSFGQQASYPQQPPPAQGVAPPKQVPQQQAPGLYGPTWTERLSVFLTNDGPKYIFIGLWVALNFALVFERYYQYAIVRKELFALLGHGLPMARSAAAGIKINCALMLVLVLRTFLSWLRATLIGSYLPIDKNIIFHRYIAWTIAFYTAVHIGAHYFNYNNLSKLTDDQYALVGGKAIPPSARTPFILAFTKVAGVTGFIATIVQVMMYSSAIKYIRGPMFNVFWFAHHLFIVFYVLLSFHAIQSRLEIPSFGLFVVGPMFLYGIERTARVFRGNQDTILQVAVAHPSRVLELQMRKTSFNYKPGQYLFLNCPFIAKQEWHPFTISSAPEENFVSVHIRIVGDWTGAVWAFLNPNKKLGIVQENVITAPDGSPIFRIDGPFGAASEEVFDFNTVMLVAGGIGVTPFGSILKSINFRIKLSQQTRIEKVYFYWISRDKNAFEWFNEVLAALEQDNINNFLEICTYLTGQLSVEEIRNVIYGLDSDTDQITGLQSPTYFGRPNWDQIFQEKAQKHQGRTVGVFFCGPAVLSKQLYNMAKKYTNPNTLTKFVYHKENF